MAARAVAPPLRSMTGYGRGRALNAHAEAEVELRTVNGKGLNLKLRMPSERLALEPEVEARLRSGLDRGSVQGSVRVRVVKPAAADLDLEVLRRYREMEAKAEASVSDEVAAFARVMTKSAREP